MIAAYVKFPRIVGYEVNRKLWSDTHKRWNVDAMSGTDFQNELAGWPLLDKVNFLKMMLNRKVYRVKRGYSQEGLVMAVDPRKKRKRSTKLSPEYERVPFGGLPGLPPRPKIVDRFDANRYRLYGM